MSNENMVTDSLHEILNIEEVSICLHLGGNVFLKMNSPNKVVDIRQWWIPDAEQDFKHTRKGIALKPDE